MPATPRFISGTSVEIVDPPPRGSVRHAIFDWDGTLSYMRDGWQDFMVPMMVEVLEECPRAEARETLERLVIDFVDHLTGKQTIYQMIRLAEEVERRGGTPRPPIEYKDEYYRRLNEHILERYDRIRAGERAADEFLVDGARRFLELARARDIRCYLASGTDVEYIAEEARLVGLEQEFDGGIHGALPNYEDFSKAKVIRDIITANDLHGPELMVVGDGYVEIENGRDVGAVRLGLVTEERNRYHMNENKRERLVRAGAQLIASDLGEGEAVLDYLEA